MIQIVGMNVIMRLLRVMCLSLLMLFSLAVLSVPIGMQASLLMANQVVHTEIEVMEPFTPTGHFIAVITPTNEWNNEIPLVASPILDSQGVIFASLQETGVGHNTILRSIDGGNHWDTIQIPVSTYHAELALSPNFAQDRIVFGGFSNGLYRSTDGGSQWTFISMPPVTQIDLLRVSPNYIADHTLFVGSYGGGVHRSTDNGLSWSLITTDTAPYVTDLEVSPGYPADPTLFVSIYNDGIFRSDNGGITWTHLTAPQFSPDFRITFSPDFDADNTLFVGASGIGDGGAFRSNNRGDSWTSIKGGSFTHLVVVSPNFAEDQTVIIGGGFGPPYISEDAGTTWYPMSDLPGLGSYGRKHNLALAYEHGLLWPIASTNQTIYRYRWPSLGLSTILVLSEAGSTEPVTVSVPLVPDEPAQTSWAASENASWLSVDPASGTLPTTMTLVADVAQLTDTAWTPLRLDTQWSLRQTETITVPVGAILVRSQVYLPLVSKPWSGIYGRVTDNGVPAASVHLALQRATGSVWSTLDTTYTQDDGSFAFMTAPSLAPGQRYAVAFLGGTPNQLGYWQTRSLDTYAAGSTVHIGDFDIANIALLSPANGAAASLPLVFQWTPRSAVPSDSYTFYMTGGDAYYYSAPLGFVGSFTLTTLPAGFIVGQPNYWGVYVYRPDGSYGFSHEGRQITFTSVGLSVQRPPAVRIIPLIQTRTLQFEDRAMWSVVEEHKR